MADHTVTTSAAQVVAIPPRLLDRDGAAAYMATSTDTVDRLIHAGHLPVVRMPIQRHRITGRGQAGVNRRVLIDVRDLDALIDSSKEKF